MLHYKAGLLLGLIRSTGTEQSWIEWDSGVVAGFFWLWCFGRTKANLGVSKKASFSA